MPLLAALLKPLLLHLAAVWFALTKTQLGIRVAVAVGIAGTYVACVTGFTVFIAPLISALFSTSYGQVIGLAFPPVSGTVLAGIVGLWVSLVAKNYYLKTIKLAVG